MQIVIDIPEDKYMEYIKIGDSRDLLFEAIRNGRLIDAEKTDVLDKIRAEIENDWQLKKYPSSPVSCGLRRAMEIIDKHLKEVEE